MIPSYGEVVLVSWSGDVVARSLSCGVVVGTLFDNVLVLPLSSGVVAVPLFDNTHVMIPLSDDVILV